MDILCLLFFGFFYWIGWFFGLVARPFYVGFYNGFTAYYTKDVDQLAKDSGINLNNVDDLQD